MQAFQTAQVHAGSIRTARSRTCKCGPITPPDSSVVAPPWMLLQTSHFQCCPELCKVRGHHSLISSVMHMSCSSMLHPVGSWVLEHYLQRPAAKVHSQRGEAKQKERHLSGYLPQHYACIHTACKTALPQQAMQAQHAAWPVCLAWSLAPPACAAALATLIQIRHVQRQCQAKSGQAWSGSHASTDVQMLTSR